SCRCARPYTNGRKPTPCTTPRTRNRRRSVVSTRPASRTRVRRASVRDPGDDVGEPQVKSAPLPLYSPGGRCEAGEEVSMPAVGTSVIEPDALEVLVAALAARGFRVLGPTVRDGAIVYDDLASAAELPIGWTDAQEPGRYRLERREDEARFGYAVGPHSWKQFLLPARVRLWRARRQDGGFEVEEEP